MPFHPADSPYVDFVNRLSEMIHRDLPNPRFNAEASQSPPLTPEKVEI
jgi:hypothetical protein